MQLYLIMLSAFQILISLIAKTIYRKDYFLLKSKLLIVYDEITALGKNDDTLILEKLLISGEDHRFKYHFGFDIIAILRAIKKRILLSKLEGASTIEQQLVRVLTNNFQITFSRKIKEIFLATTLQELVPRKQIPLIYLHVAYYGHNILGYRQLFIKLGISNDVVLTEDIAAEVIARIKYPEANIESNNRNNQIQRRKMHLLHIYKQHQQRTFLPIH